MVGMTPRQPRHWLPGLGGDLHRILRCREYRPGTFDYLEPDRRHQYCLPVPLYQLRAKYALQLPHAGAQRRLGDETSFSRAREIELLGQSDQIMQLLERC